MKKSTLEELLLNPVVVDIENEIAQANNSSIYKDNLPLLLKFASKEIELSLIPINQIEDYIIRNRDLIVKFGNNLLANEMQEGLSTGIAISYAIYLIYLEGSQTALLQYIKRRRIPQSQLFLEKLLGIKSKLNFC